MTTLAIARRTICLFAVLLIQLGTPLAADDLPPGVVDTQAPGDIPLTPAESLKRITVPDGFHVSLFAGEPDVRRPIAFDFDDRGRVWVVENYSHPDWKAGPGRDRILILEDVDHDGQFDKRTVFWDRGRYLTGIAVGHGGVWIANTPELAFIPDRDRDDRPDSEPQVILDGFQISNNNVLNNFHWGPDGWLYGAIGLGTPSLVGAPDSPPEQRTRISRGIWRFHPIDGRFEVVARGMVNPWGADFNQFGDLITSNTVLAHLWHIVPGMYCQRRGTEHDNPFTYETIQSITDHLHWGGGVWQSSRESAEHHSVAGGGHAHCGGMIYLGGNWPAEYRGTFFTNNLHGNRINNDQLVARNSSYVGVHRPDFLFGNDPWFRGMSVKYGADGGVYVSDWHDLGECHDKDGSHRSSGRIFKVVYGTPTATRVDLQQQSDRELAEWHQHANAWHARHARRILHERSEAGRLDAEALQVLRNLFRSSDDEEIVLRAMWTRYVVGDLGENELRLLLQSANQHVRRWAVRFLVDRASPTDDAVSALRHLARDEPSPKVRLAIASALQRLAPEKRWSIAVELASHEEDAEDQYLPLMIWYALEPDVMTNVSRSLEFAAGSKLPPVRRLIVRRVLDKETPDTEAVVRMALKLGADEDRADVVAGMLLALENSGRHTAPPSWDRLYTAVQRDASPQLRSLGVRMATVFGDPVALKQLRATVFDDSVPEARRRETLEALLRVNQGVTAAMLHRLIRLGGELRTAAIPALQRQHQSDSAQVLLEIYPELDPGERQDAIGVLTTRANLAAELLVQVEKGDIDRADVSAFALQRLRTFRETRIKQMVERLWADAGAVVEKSEQIARFKQLLTADYLATGDASRGRVLFEATCAKCHKLFGEGNSLGPDLTGSGRKKLDYLISNLVDPNALIDPAYRVTVVITADGQVLNGFMVQHTERHLLLRTQQGDIRLQMKDVDELATSSTSMMPERMLDRYSDTEIRDLVRYLQSDRQVPLPTASGN